MRDCKLLALLKMRLQMKYSYNIFMQRVYKLNSKSNKNTKIQNMQ